MNQNNYINGPDLDYFMNEELCDVVFVVNGQRIPAFSPLLCVKSLVFRDMFSGKHKESGDKVIPIEDTTVEAFKTFIRFFFWEQLVFSHDNDFELIGQVFKLSDKYQFCRLSNKIKDLIKSPLNLTENLRSVTRVAFKYNMEEVMTIVMQFIAININEIIHRDIEELSEINDSTKNGVFDILTSGRVRNHARLIHFHVDGRHLYVKGLAVVWKHFPFSQHSSEAHINGSVEAFKVLIGFLYFNRLIIKDKNDLKLIREVCEMADRYSVDGLMDAISADLINRITFENLRPILKISSDFEIKELIEKVLEFIRINIEEVVKRDVEELASETNNDLVLIRDILKLTQKYDVLVELKNRMAVLLMHFITFDNIVIVHKIAVDFKIEDLITNTKTFIDKNMSQLFDKNTKEVIEMNHSLDDSLIEVMFKQLSDKQSVCLKRRRKANAKYF